MATFAWMASPTQAEDHWSLESVEKAPVPAGTHPVDHFIQEKLAEEGLAQNPTADRFTLLRRATIDLTGLPSTPAEIESFGNDSSDDAWEKLIDRLLASPHYGERWGRHWLDVARYVQGTIKVPGIDEIDLAAPYRDYVVRSLNADKPYDRFLTEQLAGDLIGTPDESEAAYFDRITAPAFLSIGQWFEECTDPNKLRLDIIDEQISTLTRAFLAMDFACSRCHDHKYDPIPIRDYYAMAGMFRSTKITSEFAEEWKDGRPRMVIPLAPEEEVAALTKQRNEVYELLNRRRDLLENFRATEVLPGADFPAPGKLPGEIISFEAEDFDGHKNLRTRRLGGSEIIETRKAIDRWIKYRVVLEEPGDYTLLIRYASEVPAPVTLELDLEDQPDSILSEATFGETLEHFAWHPVPLRNIEKGSLHIRLKADPNDPFPILDQFRIVKGILEPQDPSWLKQLGEPTLANTIAYLELDEQNKIRALDRQITEARNAIPWPETTLGVTDEKKPISLPIHTAGETYQTEGDPIPRGVPTLANHLIETSFPVPGEESGRAQLAEWLTHPDHPLTARVMVNRIWHWHFGTGLVRTTDDFGKQSSPPTHPELLDWLAAEFIESGWSIKHIQRLILTSQTYQSSSLEKEENLEKDPDNKWFSRYPVRRLEVEAIYDGMLSSIGKVPRQPAGEPLDNSRSKDRALYILTSARSPMGLGLEIRKMFPLFGFDESGRPMHDRDESKTADQSLWWLNNPLPRYYAEKLAESLLAEYENATDRANAAYERVMGRPLNGPAESALLRYVEDLQTNEQLSAQEAWTRACLGLYSSHPFSHLE
ncbi:MAG: DUF1549 and DUF1553 domain-containing protein [Verrucomicrobiota bacterium]